MMLSPSAELVPAHAMLPSPALVAYAGLLALPGAALDEAVAQAVRDNPALVVDDPVGDPEPVRRVAATAPLAGAGRDRQATTTWPDPPVPEAWRDALLRDLCMELPSADAELALIVVGCLDDHGFLADDPIAVAVQRGHSPDAVDHVLTVLRDVGPPGIAARDARHCLELQLDRLPGTDPSRPLARAIVADHLEALARGRLSAVAAALGTDLDTVVQARDYIRDHVRPHACIDADASVSADPTPYVRPDVVIRLRSDPQLGFDVEVVEANRYAVHVDPAMRSVARDGRDPALIDLVSRADFFLDRLRERWATLRRIATFVAERQRGYLSDGPAAAVPLTRASVAQALGIHESTVSRAIAGKYVELPDHRTVPFAAFFDRSTAARTALRTMLASSPASVTDADLSDRLQAAGYHVARRTVAKYRAAMGVLPSTGRA